VLVKPHPSYRIVSLTGKPSKITVWLGRRLPAASSIHRPTPLQNPAALPRARLVLAATAGFRIFISYGVFVDPPRVQPRARMSGTICARRYVTTDGA
jgi:hypothetical protein